ncbi:MAG: VanZ family protein [Gemmataceae bacterium]
MSFFNSPRFWRYWLLTFGLWTFGLVMPGTWFGQVASFSVGDIGLAKVLHFVMYASLAAFAGWLPLKYRTRLLIALPLLSAHGAITEVIQLWVPARTGCVRDWVIDTAGILTGLLLALWRWPADNAAGQQ